MILDDGLEAVEAKRPEAFPLAQPVFRFLERSRLQRADLLAANLAPPDQARALEHFHVLRCAREAHCEGLSQLPDGAVAEREAGEHPAAGRIGQRMKGRVESLFNHAV